jgi:hypothetical protein
MPAIIEEASRCLSLSIALRVKQDPHLKQLCKTLIVRCAAMPFVQAAISEKADLSAFRQKPSLMVLVGVFAIVLSFLLGWPAVAVLGILSIKLQAPWVFVVGGPLIYGFSHLVFLLGMYLSGAAYSLIFCRWLIRVIMERCLAWVVIKKHADTPVARLD